MLCGKGLVRTQDLGYQAEHYDHCTTRPVEIHTYTYIQILRNTCAYIYISVDRMIHTAYIRICTKKMFYKYVYVCIWYVWACICMYRMYMYVYVCICMYIFGMYGMYCMYCMYSMYVYVLYILYLSVCIVCIACIHMYWHYPYFYLHTHTYNTGILEYTYALYVCVHMYTSNTCNITC